MEISSFFKMPRFVFGLFSQLFVMMTLQYITPNISTHLATFGFTNPEIGVTFGLPAILYACSCPFIFIITKYIKKRGLMLIGFLGIVIALLMIASSDLLPFIGDNKH